MADLAIIMGAALVGGFITYRLKLPVLLGYLVAGIFIGPYSFGLVSNVELIETMATIGVVLLLFTLGMEFPVREIKRVGRIGILGGSTQIVITAALGFIFTWTLFGFSTTESVFFGVLIAFSSTVIVLKILVERGETNTPHGRIMIAILLMQDLAVLPLMIIIPALGEHTSGLLYTLGISIGSALLFLGGIAIIGVWVVPFFLGQTAGTRSRELFLITVLAICMGAAFGTEHFGASEAFGAFAAGMIIGRSHFAHQALADIIPIRNSFAALFFISLGMLFNPQFIASNWGLVILLTLVIVIIKMIVCSGIARGFGFSFKTLLFTGAGLAHVGEFSFIISQAGLETGLISQDFYSLVLSSAILTMLLTPLSFKLAEVLYSRLSASKYVPQFLRRGSDQRLFNIKQKHEKHVIICGHGRTGSNLSEVLREYDIPYVAIELNPQIISKLRSDGIPCIYGDAGNSKILSMAHVDKARVLALTCPDPMAQVTATAYAKEVNPDIDVIVLLQDEADNKKMSDMGVSEAIEPAFEASLEFVRHILGYYGVGIEEIEQVACPFIREKELQEELGIT